MLAMYVYYSNFVNHANLGIIIVFFAAHASSIHAKSYLLLFSFQTQDFLTELELFLLNVTEAFPEGMPVIQMDSLGCVSILEARRPDWSDSRVVEAAH